MDWGHPRPYSSTLGEFANPVQIVDKNLSALKYWECWKYIFVHELHEYANIRLIYHL
jgi:hypothetical protein